MSTQDTQNPTPTDTKAEEEGKEEMQALNPAVLLRAPRLLGMRVLEKQAFVKTIPTVAAYVKDKKDIEIIRKAASPVILQDPLSRTTIHAKTLYGNEGLRNFIFPLIPSVNPEGV
ncbi:hypothetical protein AA313_de0205714 [Arthrobotrys entomopaga]|nr:hypothetical protein AA313_de0205714 [Arthrobotrys entomopaga]